MSAIFARSSALIGGVPLVIRSSYFSRSVFGGFVDPFCSGLSLGMPWRLPRVVVVAERNQRSAAVERGPMHWEWIQDTPHQGRAVCRELGLALLVVAFDGPPFVYWRFRGELLGEVPFGLPN